MQRAIFFKNLTLIVLGFSLVSCAYLQKKRDEIQGVNQIEGEGAENIVNTDIDYEGRGSDAGIRGLKTVFFGLDSSHLSEKTKKLLQENKKWMDKNPQVKKMEIEGHCDHLGSEAYNIGLGRRRAQQVFDYLISIGVDASKMSVISYGEERPYSSQNNLNRRANFVPIY